MLRKNIIQNFDKSSIILFYKVKENSNELLTTLLFEYLNKKDEILAKHNEVIKYLKQTSTDPLKVDLTPIYLILNKNNPNKPYNIYIANKNLIIKNTTYPQDKDFDLSFAKKEFQRDFDSNTVGITTPVLESYSKNFLSYTDSYFCYNNDKKYSLIQISYNYTSLHKEYLKLQNLINSFTNIISTNAYLFTNTGYIYKFDFFNSEKQKASLNQILNNIKEGEKLKSYLDKNSLQTIDIDDKRIMRLATKSIIFDGSNILYEIIIDKKPLEDELFYLKLAFLAMIIFGIFGIILSAILFQKENKLSVQDKFVSSAIHEIKTPLSVISINNELRKMQLGDDKYTQEIENALKTLNSSYEDMCFATLNQQHNLALEIINVSNMVKKRVDYFQSVANSNEKEIKLKIKNDLYIKISYDELNRLIDNNISNSIKYAKPYTAIKISLENETLCFETKSNKIQNKSKIFKRYYREANQKGGYGLGLSIIKNICKKYNIKIDLTSDEEKTTFCYTFKQEKVT